MDAEQREKVESAITKTFMWSFKKGDNIVYNYEILWELYAAKSKAEFLRKRYYNKPIVLEIVAIIECILDDFVSHRIKEHVHDKIPNITSKEIAELRAKKQDKLNHYISAARKYELFGSDSDFYETLDLLRVMRNRFHIQNTENKLEGDEAKVFTDANRKQAEQVFETILETMMRKFPRSWSDRPKVQYGDMPLPWEEIP